MKLDNLVRKYLTGVKVTSKGKEYDFSFNNYGAHVIEKENNKQYQIRLKDNNLKTYYEMLGYFDEKEVNNILLHQIKNRRSKK